MIDTTLKDYATRAAASLTLAAFVAIPLVLTEPSDARQNPAGTMVRPEARATISGPARAVDGDSLQVGGIRVRLEGIDAPEIDQTCVDRGGRRWACGTAALEAAASLVALTLVECEERGLDRYKRVLAVCRAGGVEINAELVRRGLAWAFTRYSQTYVAEEAAARARGIGVWSGPAQPPWDYRADRWHHASDSAEAPPGCPIKGNVTANGRIYHLPWSPWYGRIRMDVGRGKRWFCTEEEAIAAGWRAASLR